MANETETNENEKMPMQTRVEPPLYSVINRLATEDDRSLSNTIDRLLKTHPRVQPLLEAEAAGVSA